MGAAIGYGLMRYGACDRLRFNSAIIVSADVSLNSGVIKEIKRQQNTPNEASGIQWAVYSKIDNNIFQECGNITAD